MKYDDPVISKQRQGIGHTKNQAYSNITINNGICHRGSEICDRNATKICFKCSIMTGDTRLDIMFTPALTIKTVDALDQVITQQVKQPEFNPIELLHPPLPEPIKVAPQLEEDELDKAHFINHIADKITHRHSGHMKIHTHYPIYGMLSGTTCHVCNYPIFGATMCPRCSMIIED
ncbi:hypothetical protein DOJK_00214 [Patescibacteria group bacterium]|nr:hypothetical protein DOJK_00214 [Patescibacteria group bacterium]